MFQWAGSGELKHFVNEFRLNLFWRSSCHTNQPLPTRQLGILISCLTIDLQVSKLNWQTERLVKLGLVLQREMQVRFQRLSSITATANLLPTGDFVAGFKADAISYQVSIEAVFTLGMFDDDMICRVMTPLVVAKKQGEKMSFYTGDDFEQWSKK